MYIRKGMTYWTLVAQPIIKPQGKCFHDCEVFD